MIATFAERFDAVYPLADHGMIHLLGALGCVLLVAGMVMIIYGIVIHDLKKAFPEGE